MAKRPSPRHWDAARVRALRRGLELSQQALAREMGIRQQTVSDWETGIYTPSPLASTMLSMLAERSQVPYEASSGTTAGRPDRPEHHPNGETESS